MNTGEHQLMLLPSLSTSRRMDTSVQEWGESSILGNPVEMMISSISLPYFHGKNKVSADHNSWHSFENVSDNMLMDGQTADQALKTLQQTKLN